MTGGRLSGWDCEDVAAAHLEHNEDYRVVQAHARQTSRVQAGRVVTTRKHDLLMGRFDLLAFNDQHCLRVQVTRDTNLSEKLAQAAGPTPHYCVDEVWQWGDGGFARWWNTCDGWRKRDPVRVEDPKRLLDRADTSLDEVEQ